MSEIPQDIRDDIMAAAQFAVARLSPNCSDDADVEVIALAILAHEREVIERCAKIAEGRFTDTSGGPVAKIVADAIRETAR